MKISRSSIRRHLAKIIPDYSRRNRFWPCGNRRFVCRSCRRRALFCIRHVGGHRLSQGRCGEIRVLPVASKILLGGISPAVMADASAGRRFSMVCESVRFSRRPQAMTIQIDWSDPALRAILACEDGSKAWKMVDTYLGPIRDAIWAKRRSIRPKRGGRRTASQRKRRPSRWRRRSRKAEGCGRRSRWKKR